MRKITAIILVCVFCLTPAVPAFAYNYDFSTGEDTLPGFGKSTSNDNPVTPDPMGENTRRNKDAALLPPPYGIFSGDIPTDPSSPYHDNTPSGAGNGYNIGGQGDAAPNSPQGGDYYPTILSDIPPAPGGADGSTSIITANTEPLGRDSLVLLEQIRTIDKERLKEYIGTLDGETMSRIDKALAVSVGLSV